MRTVLFYLLIILLFIDLPYYEFIFIIFNSQMNETGVLGFWVLGVLGFGFRALGMYDDFV